METGCSYVIFTDGTRTYMQSCGTGAILVQSAVSEAVINDAIGNMTNGGKLFIKAGTYTLTTTPINLGGGLVAAIGTTSIGATAVSDIELYGEGNATILNAATNMNGAVIGVYGANNWYIHDLQINGNRAHQSDSGNSFPYLVGIFLFNSNNDMIEHCYVHDNKTYGISVTGNLDSILNNYVVNNNANGILVYGGSDYLIQNNTIDGSSDVGISISGGQPSYISQVICTGNIVKNANLDVSPWGLNTGIGILVGDNGPASNVTVSDNQIYNTKIGIGSAPGAGGPNIDVLVSNNQVSTATGDGVYAVTTTSLTIQNNIFDNIGLSTGFGYGIWSDSSLSNVTIAGTRINVNAGYNDGIYNAAAYAMINGNYINGGPLITVGQHTNIVNNTVSTSSYGLNVNSGSDDSNIVGNIVSVTSGPGIVAESKDDLLSRNRVYGGSVGVEIDSTASGTQAANNNLANNTHAISGGGYSSSAVTATGVIIENNTGYNPLGAITYPFNNSTDVITDSSTTYGSTPANATTLSVTQSPKSVMIVIGSGWTGSHTFVIRIDGTQILSTTNPSANTVYTFTLQPGETFYCQYQSGQATFQVSGE
jgi:hypothetical protein